MSGHKANTQGTNVCKKRKRVGDDNCSSYYCRDVNMPAVTNPANVVGSYRATLKNPRASDDAKRKAERFLREHGVLDEDEGVEALDEEVNGALSDKFRKGLNKCPEQGWNMALDDHE